MELLPILFRRQFVLGLAIASVACAGPGCVQAQLLPQAVRSPETGAIVQTADLRLQPATGLDALAPAVAPVAQPGPHLAVLAAGQPTLLRRPGGAKGLFLVVATPELNVEGGAVSIRLDGATNDDTLSIPASDAEIIPPLACFHDETTPAPAPKRSAPLLRRTLSLGDSERFWVIRPANLPPAGQPYDEVEILADRAAMGMHCAVYLDKTATDASAVAACAELADEFDKVIYPTDTRVFGSSPVMAGEDKIALVITHEVSGSGKTPVVAFFARRDLEIRTADQPAFRHSNQRPILFIDSATLATDRRGDLHAAVAHEFQHLINYHHKAHLAGQADGEVRWLDEALAMYASAACGYGVGESRIMYQHVASFLKSAYKYSLTDWPGNPGGAGYGNGYLFIQYLVDRFGEGLLTDVVASPGRGKMGLDAQLRKHGSSYQAIFADWAVALANTGLYQDDGGYAFKSLALRGSTKFGELRGPTAIRLGGVGARLPRRADMAFLFHLKPGPGDGDLVLRSAGGPFFGMALLP